MQHHEKRGLPQHGLHGFAMNREPISRVPITSNTQPDFASCVNSCRNVASCVGTSYVVTTSLCTYFSTFTSVGADTGTNVAFPANIACPNLNGFSYLDYSGSEYGILCNQSYPASSNITTQSGNTSLATCSNACSYSANCLASSFVNGQCTFVSNLNSNTTPGQNLPGAVVLVLLQSRVVDVISSTGSTSRSTSFSVVRGLPTAAAAVQKGSNPYNAVASAWVGCGNAFWQPRCATAATTSAVSRFSTVYTPTTTTTTTTPSPVQTLSSSVSRPTSTAVPPSSSSMLSSSLSSSSPTSRSSSAASLVSSPSASTSVTSRAPTTSFVSTSSSATSSLNCSSKNLLGLLPLGCT